MFKYKKHGSILFIFYFSYSASYTYFSETLYSSAFPFIGYLLLIFNFFYQLIIHPNNIHLTDVSYFIEIILDALFFFVIQMILKSIHN